MKWYNRDSVFVIVIRPKELTSEKSWTENRQGKDVFLFSKVQILLLIPEAAVAIIQSYVFAILRTLYTREVN